MRSPALLIILALITPTLALADQYDDLRTYAAEVPVADVDHKVKEFIAKETNEFSDGMQSHYTLALYEDTRRGISWHILDGYYVLQSGRILFLDFEYDPATKSFWPIENYKRFTPGFAKRFLLEADQTCNPYLRHFVGVVRATSLGTVGIDSLRNFFRMTFNQQPVFVSDNNDLYIIDQQHSAMFSTRPVFTLDETTLITNLRNATGLESEIIPSGRQPSTPEVIKTYVGASGACL